MRPVMLVTSWGVPCGIAEHSAMLVDAVHAIDPMQEIIVAHEGGTLPASPDMVYATAARDDIGVVHLNYHAALHSRFTPEHVAQLKSIGCRVIITYHDTGVPNSEQCKALHAVADAFIIHEDADDLPGALYWRMGVLDWADPYRIDHSRLGPYKGNRPVLGTVGFPFPWKCYDELARVTASMGWGLLLLAPNATPADVERWRGLNPQIDVVTTFEDRWKVVARLAGCDATAFTYVTHNTGQSGAILQGIAARKPVIALSTCRQFRALQDEPLAQRGILWCETFDEVAFELRHLVLERVDCRIVALAEQESWAKLGQKYLDLYRELLV